MTFVEVLVATSLIALLMGGLMPLLSSGQLTWEHAHRRTAMVQNTRTAMDSLIHSLRAAGEFQVLGGGTLRFTFFFGDGSAPPPTVEYRLNGTELEYRWAPDPFQPLAGPFRALSVTCYDSSGGMIACTNVAAVRSVQVALVAMDPDGVVPDITVTSRAFRQVP